jgi:predicted nucleotidyltransferase
MRRDEALGILAAHRNDLKRHHVAKLSLFGSVARDEAGPTSDVDILVEFAEPVGLFAFVGLKLYLEEILGRPVDLAEPEALHQRLRDKILAEAIDAA